VVVEAVRLLMKLLGIVEVLVAVHWQISQLLPRVVVLEIVVQRDLEQVKTRDLVMPNLENVVQQRFDRFESFWLAAEQELAPVEMILSFQYSVG
jgi:hypothetical protein